jgi:hypothetical protein
VMELSRLELNADEILEQVAVPVAYPDDLSNLILAWQICHWHPKLREQHLDKGRVNLRREALHRILSFRPGLLAWVIP